MEKFQLGLSTNVAGSFWENGPEGSFLGERIFFKVMVGYALVQARACTHEKCLGDYCPHDNGRECWMWLGGNGALSFHKSSPSSDRDLVEFIKHHEIVVWIQEILTTTQ